MDIRGKTALITGGAHRVGRVMTLTLAEAGANVVINYFRSAEQADRTAREAAEWGVEAMTFGADVADADAVDEMVAAARDRFGGVDILVNNASTFTQDVFPTRDLTIWRRSIDTLVHGPFHTANAVAPLMLERGEGAIVNISDLSAFEPWPGFAGHSVGKAAMLALTRQLALDLAPTVRVNAVVPGPTLRPHNYDDARYERTAAKTLLGRWGTPEDMAAAMKFLVESDYITAESITVDGGQRYGHRKDESG
ncbi:MAG: SDR family oxidoreductase [Actinomyces sp.]|nr:MAG: SDR family oxidoreductase [Actinomyces sp.]